MTERPGHAEKFGRATSLAKYAEIFNLEVARYPHFSELPPEVHLNSRHLINLAEAIDETKLQLREHFYIVNWDIGKQQFIATTIIKGEKRRVGYRARMEYLKNTLPGRKAFIDVHTHPPDASSIPSATDISLALQFRNASFLSIVAGLRRITVIPQTVESRRFGLVPLGLNLYFTSAIHIFNKIDGLDSEDRAKYLAKFGIAEYVYYPPLRWAKIEHDNPGYEELIRALVPGEFDNGITLSRQTRHSPNPPYYRLKSNTGYEYYDIFSGEMLTDEEIADLPTEKV